MFLPVQMPVSLPIQPLTHGDAPFIVWSHIRSAPLVVPEVQVVALK